VTTRARVSFAAIIACSACTTQVAHAEGPGDVYNDFVDDGVLSCNHSRAALEGVLHSGSINQYGDPLVLARLKLAIRKQLAGGCVRRRASQQTRNAGATGTAGAPKPKTKKDHPGRTRLIPPPTYVHPGSASAGNGEFVAQRALLGGFLIAALAISGWLTRRALGRRD
jgi:hypothetical protein